VAFSTTKSITINNWLTLSCYHRNRHEGNTGNRIQIKEGAVKYIVQMEIDPETGAKMEANPEKLQEWIGRRQALKPIGMYFTITRRAATIILDVPNEDAMFELLHDAWVMTNSYPEVWPVADASEFPALMQRMMG
jgi:hypothetical protein